MPSNTDAHSGVTIEAGGRSVSVWVRASPLNTAEINPCTGGGRDTEANVPGHPFERDRLDKGADLTA